MSNCRPVKLLLIYCTIGIICAQVALLQQVIGVDPGPRGLHNLGFKDLPLNTPTRLYNPSLVGYGSYLLAAVRQTNLPGAAGLIHGRRVERVVENWVHICVVDTNKTLSTSCKPFDPWHGTFVDCVWDEDDWKKLGPTAFIGVDDTKLFIWPGKGVFALVTRRAEAHSPGDMACRHLNFMQYLAQVIPETVSSDQWHLPRPLALRLNNEADVYGNRTEIVEKNWMPFVYNNNLYVTYHVVPQHMVYQAVDAHLPLTLMYATESDVLMARFPGAVGLHGGPPVIMIPSSISASGKSYYLGIVHFKKWRRDGLLYYPHYFYKMQPHPPFRITHVASRRIPLKLEDKADEWRRRIAFVSGQWLNKGRKQLFISYGSADKNARLILLPVTTVELFFHPESTHKT